VFPGTLIPVMITQCLVGFRNLSAVDAPRASTYSGVQSSSDGRHSAEAATDIRDNVVLVCNGLC